MRLHKLRKYRSQRNDNRQPWAGEAEAEVVTGWRLAGLGALAGWP